MQILWTAEVHYLMTLIHVTCAMFWLGWMVFFSAIMSPVLRRVVPESFEKLGAILQYRTRRAVNGLILLLVITGAYNMAYRGLTEVKTLLYTPYGLRFILKLFLAALLIGLYFLAPDFSKMANRSSVDPKREERVASYVHGIILLLGLTVAFLGISLGG